MEYLVLPYTPGFCRGDQAYSPYVLPRSHLLILQMTIRAGQAYFTATIGSES
jgi:hypothetical protein